MVEERCCVERMLPMHKKSLSTISFLALRSKQARRTGKRHHNPFLSEEWQLLSYESKFHSNVQQTDKEGKHEHRTMGNAEEHLPDPQQFLKKHPQPSKESLGELCLLLLLLRLSQFIVFAKDALSSKDLQPRKAPVPRAHDAPKMAVRSEKNFIQSNALDVVLTVPKRAERKFVDDRFGDTFSLDPSGWTPKYLMKKVPLLVFSSDTSLSLSLSFFAGFWRSPRVPESTPGRRAKSPRRLSVVPLESSASWRNARNVRAGTSNARRRTEETMASGSPRIPTTRRADETVRERHRSAREASSDLHR